MYSFIPCLRPLFFIISSFQLGDDRSAITGELQNLLDQPAPKVNPPLKVRVEYAKDVVSLDALKHEIESLLKEKLVFKAGSTLSRKEAYLGMK